MKEIIENIWHVGDSGCSVFLVNTKSKDGLVLIDAGMSLGLVKKISKANLNPMNIQHCILTHFHIDHTAACADLKGFNKKVKFYAHDLDADPIEQRGHDEKTAASWYGINYTPIKLERRFKGENDALKLGNLEFKIIHIPGHTPGSVAVLIKMNDKKVLFGQDIHGPFMASFGSNLEDYQASMQKLLNLNADILCEGHFGIFRPAKKVRDYIIGYMKENAPKSY